MTSHAGDFEAEQPVMPAVHWQRLAESVPHIAWIIRSPDGEVEYLNQQAEEYLGWSPEMSFDGLWRAVLHPDDSETVHQVWREAVRTGTRYATEYRLRRADGAFLWHRGRGMLVSNADNVGKWIGTATDIDDHRTAVLALRESADRLAEAQRLTRVGSWSLDVASGKRVWSDELYRLLGYGVGEFEPDLDRLFERLHPDDAGRVSALVLSQSSRPDAQQDEFRLLLPGGEVRWLAIRTEPVRGDTGEVVRIQGTAQDITERKQAEVQLLFQADLLDAVGEAVVATDLDGTTIYWGPGAEDLYGWSAQEARGRTVLDLIPTVRRSYDASKVTAPWPRGESWTGMMELGRRDGSTFLAEMRRTPVFDDAGEVVAVIGTSSDVSVREATNAELAQAHRSTAEALTLLATLQAEAPVGFAFIDLEMRIVRVNHELASIIGAPLEELVGRSAAEVVPELWQQLAPIYQRVLDTGEAVRNQRVIERQGMSGQVSERLASQYPVRIEDEIIGIGLVVCDITDRVRAEGVRSAVMGQVVDGVYTEDRNGRLTYMNSAASRMLGWTEAELRGEHMHEVVHFQRFDGTPLSVADCVLLKEGHRGHVEGSEGEAFTRKDGSLFPVAYSAVPLRTGSAVEGVAVVFRDVSAPGASPNVIRVLIADDDRRTTESFKALLDRHDGIHVVGIATTSASAMEAAERLKPDVVLVDADLPGLDGLAIVTAIQANAHSTRVILMTDKHDDTIAIACIEAGCAGVLDKSRAWVELISAVRAAYHGETIISQEELQRALSKVRGGGPAGRATHLTDREQEVLACMREGLSNAMVAERLGVAANTVRNHVQRILYKLDVHSKLEAVVLTSREGLSIGPPSTP